MKIDRVRPLAAFLLVTLLCAAVLAEGMRADGQLGSPSADGPGIANALPGAVLAARAPRLIAGGGSATAGAVSFQLATASGGPHPPGSTGSASSGNPGAGRASAPMVPSAHAAARARAKGGAAVDAGPGHARGKTKRAKARISARIHADVRRGHGHGRGRG